MLQLQISPLLDPLTSAAAIILLIAILIFFMAVAAGAEIAFFSLTVKDINYLKTTQRVGSKQAIKLLGNTEFLSSALRASKYILSVAIIVAAVYLVKISDVSHPKMATLMVAASTIFVLILLGEVLPKVYARENNIRIVIFSAPIVQFMSIIFSPGARLLADSKEYLEQKKMRQHQFEMDDKAFQEIITENMGHVASKEEVDIFKGILNFGKITVKQIMTPRLEISALRETWDFERVREKMLNTNLSRMPVYKETIDEIIGVIHSKDLIPYYDTNQTDWRQLIKPVYFVHQQKLIGDLLREFQQKKNHFAVVADEFGGTSGVVTLTDIMKEIVGKLRGEHDENEMNYKKIDDNNFIFDGKILLNDLCRILQIPIESFEKTRGDSDSLAGLVLEIAGRFPAINEQFEHEEENFTVEFTVLSIDKLRINRIKVELFNKES